jgi:hypothetical protein
MYHIKQLYFDLNGHLLFQRCFLKTYIIWDKIKFLSENIKRINLKSVANFPCVVLIYFIRRATAIQPTFTFPSNMYWTISS